MRLIKIGDKKALSEIVSYALLILIAFVIGTAIFMWMRHWVVTPPEDEECPDGVAIVIRNAVCNDADDKITLTIANQGRFDISGFVLKGSNDPNLPAAMKLSLKDAPPKLTEIGEIKQIDGGGVLGIGEENSYTFGYDLLSPVSLNKISIGAVRLQSGKLVICTKSFISEDVACT